MQKKYDINTVKLKVLDIFWKWCELPCTVIVVNDCECEFCVCLHVLIRLGHWVSFETTQA